MLTFITTCSTGTGPEKSFASQVIKKRKQQQQQQQKTSMHAPTTGKRNLTVTCLEDELEFKLFFPSTNKGDKIKARAITMTNSTNVNTLPVPSAHLQKISNRSKTETKTKVNILITFDSQLPLCLMTSDKQNFTTKPRFEIANCKLSWTNSQSSKNEKNNLLKQHDGT